MKRTAQSHAANGVNPEIFFKPVELAVLATYLRRRSLLPKRIATIDARRTYKPGEWDEEQDGIAPVEGTAYDSYQRALPNAVARICLSGIQDELPQWGTIDPNGKVTLARKVVSPVALPPRILLSEFLFKINWADSGPGYSWPEAYYATVVPCFDMTIVTLSQDSPDAYGYCDIGIGHFRNTDDSAKQSHKIITGHWRHLKEKFGQQKWTELFASGAISGQAAEEWATQVWGAGRSPDSELTLLDILERHAAKQDDSC